MAQSINITELNLPQLEMLKNQLDQVRSGASTFLALHVLRPREVPRPRAFQLREASFPWETPIRSQVPPPLTVPTSLGLPS